MDKATAVFRDGISCSLSKMLIGKGLKPLVKRLFAKS
jgi:hypothetical protein